MSRPVRVGLLMRTRAETHEPFGALTGLVATLSEAGRMLGMAVFGFDPLDLDLPGQSVRGWALAADGWQRVQHPLPDVVYARYTLPDLPHWQASLQAAGIPMVNQGALNKWRAYQLLAGDPMLAPHLPATRLLQEAADLLAWLERFEVVLLKPVAGSLGRGIVRCSRLAGEDALLLAYRNRSGTGMERRVPTGRLAHWVARLLRAERYLVQQGLDLHVYQGRAADLRQLWQKDGTGSWHLTGQGARIATPGCFLANLHVGADVAPAEQLVGVALGTGQQQPGAGPAPTSREHATDTAGRWLAATEGFARRLLARLESHLGPQGEIGLDLGIDTSGKLWYLEHNMQPGKQLLARLGDSERLRLSHLRPLLYAHYLACHLPVHTAGNQVT